jgi:hypothetical protein
MSGEEESLLSGDVSQHLLYHVHYLIQKISSILRNCLTTHSMLVVCSAHIFVLSQSMVGGPSIVSCVLLLIRYMLIYLAYPEAVS